jgi:hypothetical protein
LYFSEEKLVAPVYKQIGPSCTTAPIVFDEIPKYFNDGSGRENVDQLPGNLNVSIPRQILPQVLAWVKQEIKQSLQLPRFTDHG